MHYVLIENHSGYVWGECDADNPIDACATVDRQIGGDTRTYEHAMISGTTENGYHVFAAPADWRPVNDGQSQDEIDRVMQLHKVAEVVFRNAHA